MNVSASCHIVDALKSTIWFQDGVGRRREDSEKDEISGIWAVQRSASVGEAVSRNRVEQLANSFASAVLMPQAVLDRFAEGRLAARRAADLLERVSAPLHFQRTELIP